EGFPRRAEIAARYAARSGRDLGRLDYYVAFGYWKLACILEGVYARYVAGIMGREGHGFEAFADHVVLLAETARKAVEGPCASTEAQRRSAAHRRHSVMAHG